MVLFSLLLNGIRIDVRLSHINIRLLT